MSADIYTVEDAEVVEPSNEELVYLAMDSIQLNVENLVAKLLDRLYKRIEHGDDEHRKWLKDEIEKFKDEVLINLK